MAAKCNETYKILFRIYTDNNKKEEMTQSTACIYALNKFTRQTYTFH